MGNIQKIVIYGGLAVLGIFLISGTEAKGNSPANDDWETYKKHHGKTYKSIAHEAQAKFHFDKTAAEVKAHNDAYNAGSVSYSRELNQFADQDPNQFKKQRNGFKSKRNSNAGYSDETQRKKRQAGSAPASWDWRTTGKVSPVKDQGQCGSCWSFSAIASMESQVLIANKTLQPLSEEQLVDCDRTDGGCNGGDYTTAWQYLISAGGSVTEKQYPYYAGLFMFGGLCQYPYLTGKAIQKVGNYSNIKNDTASIQEALVTLGPLSVAVDASSSAWQTYSEGILTCNTTNLDHAIQLIGYGTANGQPYWTIKNSWSATWGVNGFANISATPGQDCGITEFVASVKLA